MQIGNVSATVPVWMKIFTTNIFGKMHSKLFQIEFIRGNKKSIVIGLISWIIVNTGGYLFFYEAQNRMNNEFYHRGTVLTKNLVSKIYASLLENDILSLKVAIRNLEGVENSLYSEILDHKNRVIAHSDSKKINLQYATPEDIKNIDPIKGVFIDAWILPDNNKSIRFSTDVVYSQTKIGKVYLALPASPIYASLSKYKLLFIILIVSSTLIFAIYLVGSNLVYKAKAIRIQRELEDITRIGPYTLIKKIGQGGMALILMSMCVFFFDKGFLSIDKLLQKY
jgi:hypothetical protein